MPFSTCKLAGSIASTPLPLSVPRPSCGMPLTDMAPILSVQNLSTGYGKKQVLFGVSLDVMPGETLLITGGNGSGKSTLFKAIYGLIPPWNPDAKIVFRPDPEGANLTTSPSTFNLSKGLAYLPQMNSVFA